MGCGAMMSMRAAIDRPGAAASTTNALMPAAAEVPSARTVAGSVRANTQ